MFHGSFKRAFHLCLTTVRLVSTQPHRDNSMMVMAEHYLEGLLPWERATSVGLSLASLPSSSAFSIFFSSFARSASDKLSVGSATTAGNDICSPYLDNCYLYSKMMVWWWFDSVIQSWRSDKSSGKALWSNSTHQYIWNEITLKRITTFCPGKTGITNRWLIWWCIQVIRDY